MCSNGYATYDPSWILHYPLKPVTINLGSHGDYLDIDDRERILI